MVGRKARGNPLPDASSPMPAGISIFRFAPFAIIRGQILLVIVMMGMDNSVALSEKQVEIVAV